MNIPTQPDPQEPTRRLAAKKPLHWVDFFCRAPRARNVCVIGDFNDWHAAAHPLRRLPDGGWTLRMALPHGYHRYLFLVDGKPTLDPTAHGTVQNEQQEPVSLLAVS
jgi:1,4-alpha-glucan branching enzyme